MSARLAALAAALAAITLIPGVALAQCSTGDLACIELPEVPSRPDHLLARAEQAGMTSSASAPTPLAAVGDILPRGEYSVILNADYYGLPPASEGWVYMRVGPDALRVDWSSHEVLERATDQAAANF
jgi:hypothetical protein